MAVKQTHKLAMFLPALRGGGAEKMMLHLAQGFIDRGLQIDLVLTKAVGPYLSQVPDGVRVVDLGVSRVLKSLPGLVRYLKKEQPEILFSTLNQTNLIALTARKLSGVEMRLVVREANALWKSVRHYPCLKRYLTPYLIGRLYPFADSVIAISNGVAKDLLSLGTIPTQRLHVIYNPVVTQKMTDQYLETVSHEWFHDKNIPIILSVGRLAEQKDFPTLIRAFRILKSRCNARLMILGEGDKRHDLEKLIHSLGLEEDVQMPGFLINPLPYMANASVFVSSSAWEGFGNVIVEALAAGTQVVATLCPGGPSEILDGGRFGHLVPVGDPELMAQAIAKALDTPLPRQVLIDRGLEFSCEKAVEQYLEVLSV
ncbi:MAG: glycosyltransferase [Pedobacter sp.]